MCDLSVSLPKSYQNKKEKKEEKIIVHNTSVELFRKKNENASYKAFCYSHLLQLWLKECVALFFFLKPLVFTLCRTLALTVVIVTLFLWEGYLPPHPHLGYHGDTHQWPDCKMGCKTWWCSTEWLCRKKWLKVCESEYMVDWCIFCLFFLFFVFLFFILVCCIFFFPFYILYIYKDNLLL